MAALSSSSRLVQLPLRQSQGRQQQARRQQQRQTIVAAVHGTPAAADVGDLHRFQQLWTPPAAQLVDVQARGGAPAAAASAGDDHKPRTPPPDLPSLLLDSRIVYLGMPLVPAVTELIIAEMLYLQHKDRVKPMYLYINSTGTTRADGETVGFETEGTAIYDTMCFVKNEVHTVGVGVAIGQSCMLLSAGEKGKRFMLEHATAMLHQPRVPPTGQRQAIEIQIKWREVLAQKQNLLNILSRTTGHSPEKLDKDMQRPLYMQPKDALAYGIIDGVVTPEKKIIDDVKSADQWDKEAGLVAR
ncbi:protease complex subunit 3 [Chlorella sorokiniana]|uniref:ATP-dependent Clp protease proteolytic subunit n=1 Tax=Chlorella sorokiniana TaxID=3076 RepID=A0A2P6TKZ2_CHLSO|nr:protease complex subunit 3 [Chlorella sorokiniana]|eukprot:PRW44960.1 protease complex subunit 3 [Chlorella sorokiniana]